MVTGSLSFTGTLASLEIGIIRAAAVLYHRASSENLPVNVEYGGINFFLDGFFYLVEALGYLL